ncbi:hypothetical protein Nepgr_005326 [Nepenthes gracilis]|uniref:Transmembrane protein n=1 Tax=Nepenthes gracilis TaxID=150966 RepID=A0AAD3S300_NEPGR|nr:hypothetical protein Nepgr_005326 [Nepenthes gracilis]
MFFGALVVSICVLLQFARLGVLEAAGHYHLPAEMSLLLPRWICSRYPPDRTSAAPNFDLCESCFLEFDMVGGSARCCWCGYWLVLLDWIICAQFSSCCSPLVSALSSTDAAVVGAVVLVLFLFAGAGFCCP